MKTRQDADAVFFTAFGNAVNMFTREILSRGWVASGRHAYEISKGEGITPGTVLIGVTIVDANGVHNKDLSEAVHSMEEVEKKLESIRELYR